MEKKKTHKDLISEGQILADKMEEKKKLIKTILDDLDNKADEKGVSTEHLEGMAVVEQLFTEFDALQLEQDIIFEKINKK